MARAPAKGRGLVQTLLVVAGAAPLLVLLSALGVRAGLLSLETGWSLLTLQVAWGLAWLGAAAALAAVVLALGDLRRLGVPALAAVLIAGPTLAGFVWQKGRLATGAVEHVSTDLEEVPGFGDLRAQRGGPGPGPAVGPDVCPGAQPVMRQVAPQAAGWALEQAGFRVRGFGVQRADGTHTGYWFGVTHDAVIRIRPGRTDIRVAARDSLPHGGEACRLATRISEALRTGQ